MNWQFVCPDLNRMLFFGTEEEKEKAREIKKRMENELKKLGPELDRAHIQASFYGTSIIELDKNNE